MEVTILGAGTWGIALAEVLICNSRKVSVWHYKNDYVLDFKKNKFHQNLNFKISQKINLISKRSEINKESLILICLPSQHIRSALSDLKLENKYYVNASKGIELKTGKLISQIIEETTMATDQSIACLSGPSHAEELIKKIPTVIAVSSKNIDFSKSIQHIFSNNFFRLYQSDSIEAMQVGGAVKNIISIASGISNGLGYGDNTTAALITRGVREIIRFCKIYTPDTQSLLGISGVGDLIVTATSSHSRNKKLGTFIGKGRSLSEALSEMRMVVEGVETSRSVHYMSKKNNISMPICEEVYNILFKDKSPKLAIDDLMSRKLKSE